MIRKVFKIFGMTLLCLLFLSLLMVVILLSPPADKIRTELVQHSIEKIVGPGIKIGLFRTNLMSRLVLEDVSVEMPGSRVFVRRLSATYNLTDLMKSPPALSAVIIDSANIFIRPEAFEKDTTVVKSGDLRETMRSFRIHNLIIRPVQVGIQEDIREIHLKDFSMTAHEQALFHYLIQIQANAIVARIDTQSIHIHDIEMTAQLSPDSVHLDSLSIRIFEGEVIAQGAFCFMSPLSGRINVRFSNLQSSLLPVEVQPPLKIPEGFINGSISVAGPIQAVEEASGLMDIAWQGNAPQDRIHLSGTFLNQRAEIHLSSREAALTIRGLLRNDSLDIEYKGRLPELRLFERWTDNLHLAGNMAFSGSVIGPMEEPVAQVKLHGKCISINSFPVDDIRGKIHWQNGRLWYDHFTFNIKETAVSILHPMLIPSELPGMFEYRGELHGTPESPFASLDMWFNDVALPDYPVVSGFVHVRLKDNTVFIDSLHTTTDSLSIEGDGVMALEHQRGEVALHLSKASGSSQDGGIIKTEFNLKAKTAAFTGQKIDLHPLTVFFPDSLALSGRMDFSGRMMMNSEYPDLDLYVCITSPEFNGLQLDSMVFKAGFDGQMFILDSLRWFDPLFNGSLIAQLSVNQSEGTWSLSKTDSIFGQLKIDDVDLEKANTLIPGHLSGTGTANLALTGLLKHPAISGQFNIEHARYRQNLQTPAVDSIYCQLDFQDSVMIITRLDGRVLDRSVGITGGIALENGQRISFQNQLLIQKYPVAIIRGIALQDSLALQASVDRLPLELLLPVQDVIESMNGLLTAQLLYEKGRNSKISGEVHTSIPTIKFRNVQQSWINGNIRMRFDEKSVVIDSFNLAQSKSGFFNGSGRILYGSGSLTGAQIRANASKLNITMPGTLEVALDSLALTFSESQSQSRLSGDLMLGKSRYIQSVSLKQLIAGLTKPKPPKRPGPVWMQSTAIQVRIRNSDNLWVDNNLARLRLHPELTLSHTLDDPIISGRLQAVEGHVYYLDRKFKIVKGVLDFIDPNRINPVIDLEAVSVFKEYETLSRIKYEITLKIFRELDAARYTMTSNPPLSQPDIVALLTLGVTRQQVTQNRDQSSVSLSEALTDRAALLSSTRVSNMVSKRMGDLLGLDEVSIEGNLFRFGKEWGPQLVAGKKLSERVSLTYSTTAGNANDQKIRLDYKLSDHWSLMGETDQKGETGLDFKYRIKLK